MISEFSWRNENEAQNFTSTRWKDFWLNLAFDPDGESAKHATEIRRPGIGSGANNDSPGEARIRTVRQGWRQSKRRKPSEPKMGGDALAVSWRASRDAGNGARYERSPAPAGPVQSNQPDAGQSGHVETR